MKKWDILTLFVSTVIALALANMVFTRMPRLYNASTLVSDETQEMTIAIGLSSYLDREDESKLDDPEVYDRILDSPDFINAICRIPIGRKTYGTHLAEQLGQASSLPIAVDDFRHYVKHAENRKARTIEISVFDRNPNVAALIADSIIARLQQHIRTKKTTVLVANERHLNDECLKAHAEAERARTAYSDYYDSHRDAVAKLVVTEIDRLKKAADLAYKNYTTLTEKHLRSRFLLQQSEPSFTIVRSATVPLSPTSPSPFVVFGAALIIGLVIGWWACLLRHRILLNDWHFSPGGWFSPWSITLLVWAAILVLIRLQGDRLYPLTEQFYTAISIWIPILCSTSFITFHLLHDQRRSATSENDFITFHVNKAFFNILLALIIVMTPMYAWNVYQVVSQFSTSDMLNNMRTLAVHGDGQGILKFTIVFNQALFLVGLWAYPQIKSWKLAVIYVANVLCALALMEKGTFFLLTICTLFVLVERRVIRVRTMAVIGAISVVLMFLFNVARETTETRANDMDFLTFVSTYITSPPVAFCTLVQDLSQQWGANTFEVFYDYLNRFEIGNFVVNNKEQAFVQVPIVTNVYTVMQPFYVDFGYPGVAFFAGVYGILAGSIYRGFRNGNSIMRVLYTLLLQILILQFYQENIFLSISGLMQTVIIITLLTQQKFTLFQHHVQRNSADVNI